LAIGEFEAWARGHFISNKRYGEYLARELPESAWLDSPTRTHCKWLWTAANDPGGDLILVLNHRLRRLGKRQINDIEQYAQTAAHPSSIRRNYDQEKGILQDEAIAHGNGFESLEAMRAHAARTQVDTFFVALERWHKEIASFPSPVLVADAAYQTLKALLMLESVDQMREKLVDRYGTRHHRKA
jgi:hypothetical protein